VADRDRAGHQVSPHAEGRLALQEEVHSGKNRCEVKVGREYSYWLVGERQVVSIALADQVFELVVSIHVCQIREMVHMREG
jgi:hypothetical protein